MTDERLAEIRAAIRTGHRKPKDVHELLCEVERLRAQEAERAERSRALGEQERINSAVDAAVAERPDFAGYLAPYKKPVE